MIIIRENEMKPEERSFLISESVRGEGAHLFGAHMERFANELLPRDELTKEIKISRSSEGFHLITRIQDEAHRFAITFHRKLRSDRQVHSVLDDIPGIGPKRRLALMKRFESLDEIRNATMEDLISVEGFNVKAAESVYSFFHK